MNRRIIKKRVDVFAACALSVPMVLEHAKPSLWSLPIGQQRHYVYRTAVDKLHVHPSHAKRATWLIYRRRQS